MYLKFLVPIAVMIYLIKKNPFYQSFPIMMPLMCVGVVFAIAQMIKYSRATNMMVKQVLLDPTGTELTFTYMNQMNRRFRNDQAEKTLMIPGLIDPPQGGEFKPLEGDLFPSEYPLKDPLVERHHTAFFWRKYYVTQRLFFTFAKRAHYCNLEILTHAF